VLEEIGKRLHLEIRPFALTKRQVLVDRLVYDPKVLESAWEYAREKGVPREIVMSDVRKYAAEIVPPSTRTSTSGSDTGSPGALHARCTASARVHRRGGLSRVDRRRASCSR